MRTISRISVDFELRRLFRRLKPGVVLDAGSKNSPYKQYIPHTKYLRLDIDNETKPDICCDMHKIEWQADYFDTIIATEVLEHLHGPQTAVNELHRILKQNGICIAAVPFLYPYHAHPKDYYRFTQDSLRHLFRNFGEVEIIPHGNKVQTIWQLVTAGQAGRILNVLNPLLALLTSKKDAVFCSGFIIYARK